MKRLTAILLAAVLLFGAIPLSGAAFTDAGKISAKHQTAVEAMSAKGVISGFPDGSFRPGETLTRAQAAKILCVAVAGADKADALAKTDTGFSDVPPSHWAAKYIAFCAEKKIVAGVGDGKYDPDGVLTAAAFAKMLLVAFGRGDAKELVGERWAANTQNAVKDAKLNDGAETANEPTTRENACQLAYNFLQDAQPEDPAAKYLVAAPALPTLPQRPRETDYADAKGGIDWDAFNKAQKTWHESSSEQLKDTELYAGKLDGFLTKSIPAFLDGRAGENSVYSPLNVYLALAMLTECAGGNSRAQLLELLGAKDTAELRKRAGALWNANYLDDGVSKTLLASSLWMNQDIEFVQPTMDVLAKEYRASSYRGEVGTKEFNAALQAWLNEKTGGMLKEQVEGVETEKDTLLTILTAIYLKAPWTSEFSKSATKPDTFHAKSGDLTCDFLHGGAEKTVCRGEKFTAAEKKLWLGARSGSMWFLLPDEGVSPEELLKSGDAVRFLLSDGQQRQGEHYDIVRLHLPKFDVRSKADLIPALKTLGVTDVFVPIIADFTPSIKNTEKLKPYVSEVEHAARVKVDEEGVEAAAYTEISILKATAVMQQTEIDVTLDRPFVFAITGADGLPLFVGIVNKPA